MINKILNAVVALLFFAVVAMSAMGTDWFVTPLTLIENDSSGIVHIGTGIFTTYVVAFEVLALVLLAGLERVVVGGDENDALQVELAVRFLRGDEVPVVYGVERPAHNADSARTLRHQWVLYALLGMG